MAETEITNGVDAESNANPATSNERELLEYAAAFVEETVLRIAVNDAVKEISLATFETDTDHGTIMQAADDMHAELITNMFSQAQSALFMQPAPGEADAEGEEGVEETAAQEEQGDKAQGPRAGRGA